MMSNVSQGPLFRLAAGLILFVAGCASVPSYHGKVLPTSFSNGGIHLEGILVEPSGSGPFPAVVFVHGSGPSTFDRPAWKLHANALLERGFAVLVFNKRGSAPSTGRLETADYSDLADDVVSAVLFLRKRSEIRSDHIGLLGRSEGGWVAPIAANKLGDVAFVVASSGAAVPPFDQTLYAMGAEMRRKGLSQDEISRAIALRKRIWDYYRRAANDSMLGRGALRDSLVAELQTFQAFKLEEMPAGIPSYDGAVFGAAARMRFYDPVPTLKALSCPLLVVLGERDESVEPASTLAVLERLRSENGKDITVKLLPGIGHSLMSGFPPHYASGYLDLVAEWAAAHVR